MINWTQTVTLQQAVGTTFLSIILVLVLLFATFMYLWLRLKYLGRRVTNLEYELKIVAEKLGLIPRSEPNG
jgi:hypothetical protein